MWHPRPARGPSGLKAKRRVYSDETKTVREQGRPGASRDERRRRRSSQVERRGKTRAASSARAEAGGTQRGNGRWAGVKRGSCEPALRGERLFSHFCAGGTGTVI